METQFLKYENLVNEENKIYKDSRGKVNINSNYWAFLYTS